MTTNLPEEKLAPCPFCGGRPAKRYYPTLTQIKCENCDFKIYDGGLYSDPPRNHDLIDIKWNSRPREQALEQALEQAKKDYRDLLLQWDKITDLECIAEKMAEALWTAKNHIADIHPDAKFYKPVYEALTEFEKWKGEK